MGWIGDRCLFWNPAGEQDIQHKILWIKRSNSGKNSAVQSLEVVFISRFLTKKVLAGTDKCSDLVKSY